MPDFTAKRIADMEAAYGGGFVKARAELGVSSFGLQVIRMPPGNDQHPEHDHAGDRQEEVYAVLRGSGTLHVGGERVELTPEVLVRVGPAERRRIVAGPDGLDLLAVGGVPGGAYAAPAMTELSPADGGDQPVVGGG